MWDHYAENKIRGSINGEHRLQKDLPLNSQENPRTCVTKRNDGIDRNYLEKAQVSAKNARQINPGG